ncbi:MAG TPA: glutamate--tRNA ligase family protein, partial [Calditrichia bacterium]|nr:glutamate--tRNA ligase family protein [Calditrichia bacterium]
IRGEEWLPSVPKHLQLYRYFGWEAPQMAHLSLLLNKDRSKLSKRQGDVAVEDYRDKGYLPEALVNFVALLGWSPGSEEEFFDLKQLEDLFTLERVNKAGAVFDLDKLNWMNGNYIRKMAEEDLVAFLTPFLAEGGADISDEATTRNIIKAVYKGVEKGRDTPRAAAIFLQNEVEITEEAALAYLKDPQAPTVLAAFLEKAREVDTLDDAAFKDIMKSIQKEHGIKGPALWKPVRVAITGAESGPELPLVIEVFGRDKVISVVEKVVARYL